VRARTRSGVAGGMPGRQVPVPEQLHQRLARILAHLVKQRHAVHTEDGAIRGAGLWRVRFPVDVCLACMRRKAALRHAVVHQAIFADVKVTSTGRAVPLIRHAVQMCTLTGVSALPRVPLHADPHRIVRPHIHRGSSGNR
jgi:hypothetical protein